jgi:serine/threonine protein kinase
MRAMTTQVPQKIGPYEILGLLGTGGMSQVFRARRPDFPADIALKVLSEARVQKSPVFLGRFQREVAAMMALKHPNIVEIYDAGESGGFYYLAMELLEGCSVKDRATRGIMSEAELLTMARQATEALAYCHREGVLHRDMKPTNLHLLPDGTVKLLDFGLAKSSTDVPLTHVGRRIGTPRYMAPECVRGAPPDQRSEIYQLGLIFYEGACGRAAFTDTDVMKVLQRVVNEEPPAIQFLNPGLDANVMAVIRNCICKDPNKRYQSCEELLGDLDAHAAGARIQTRC